MNPLLGLSAGAPLISSGKQLPSPSAIARGNRAAQEFEANLIASMLESLEKSFVNIQGEASPAGSDDYRYLGIQALSERMSEEGGFGIAAIIRPHLPYESKP